MLIFIENTPRSYAWGSRDALQHMLGTAATGEPQAELWLGDHPGSPATVAKATPERHTLIDLIASDPDRYGVAGGQLPFLLKVLAIGAPLSLQVHPNAEQAAAGFAAEEAAGVPRTAFERNYGDARHKPELLVALSDVTALSGFRSLEAARHDALRLAAAAPNGAARDVLDTVAEKLAARDAHTAEHLDPARVRMNFLEWALAGDEQATAASHALAAVARQLALATGDAADPDLAELRLWSLRSLAAAHPGDPGILVSLMMHLVRIGPGEALYLGAGQMHAYLAGIAVEVMAASDNVLRAGLTEKHVDVAELCRVVDTTKLHDPRFYGSSCAPGLVAWQPDVPDFRLMRARLHEHDDEVFAHTGSAAEVTVQVPFPIVLIVTEGRVRVERPHAELAEHALMRRGQSLYVSAGEPILLSGRGEAFLATVGERFATNSSHRP